jgi:hypothetical protein
MNLSDHNPSCDDYNPMEIMAISSVSDSEDSGSENFLLMVNCTLSSARYWSQISPRSRSDTSLPDSSQGLGYRDFFCGYIQPVGQ